MWQIDEQAHEYQIAYWKLRAEKAEKELAAERKRKAPETLKEMEDAVRTAQENVAHFRADVETWKKVGRQAWDRVVELEADGAAAVLKRERDQWRNQWRSCTRRLGNAIEHLGMDHLGTEPNADQP